MYKSNECCNKDTAASATARVSVRECALEFDTNRINKETGVRSIFQATEKDRDKTARQSETDIII